MSEYISDQKFKSIDYTSEPLPKGEYENCTFEECDFSKSDLSAISFEECHFNNCNLGLAEIQKTAFRNCSFKGCKMIGLHFEDANPFNFSGRFDDCDFSFSSFYKWDLSSSQFKGCSFKEADLAEANLSGLEFNDCNFYDAKFEQTNLIETDFQNAVNFNIDPEMNKIRGAKFSVDNLIGLLGKYGIKVY